MTNDDGVLKKYICCTIIKVMVIYVSRLTCSSSSSFVVNGSIRISSSFQLYSGTNKQLRNIVAVVTSTTPPNSSITQQWKIIQKQKHNNQLINSNRNFFGTRTTRVSLVLFDNNNKNDNSKQLELEQEQEQEQYSKEIIPNSGLHESIGDHIIKKSRFIGYASYVKSWSDAVDIINHVKNNIHPKARHWCYAYVSSSDGSDNDSTTEERISDDGEPSGTGGVPILSAIKSYNIQNVICIVVRYYGGIQLGTGGLIRAYGTTARNVLSIVPTQNKIPTILVQITIIPQYSNVLYDTIQKSNNHCWIDTTTNDSITYNTNNNNNDGSALIIVHCYKSYINQLQNTLNNLTKGTIQFTYKN